VQVEECWEDDRSRGPRRWPARPRSRCGECAGVGIGVRTGAMIVGTGAMTAGTGVRSISRDGPGLRVVQIGPWRLAAR
jgi:hypothetical protein